MQWELNGCRRDWWQAEATSEHCVSTDTCCITQCVAAADNDNVGNDDDDDASALVIDESATPLDSVQTECSTPPVVAEQLAPVMDDSMDAAKKRQLWIVVKRHLLPTPVTSGNSLLYCAVGLPQVMQLLLFL